MRRLRIAYALGTLRPGGAERQMLALAERLPKDRFSPAFIEFSGPGSYASRVAAAGIPVHTLGEPPLDPAAGGRFRRRISKSLAYLRAVRAGRYDIVDAWLHPAYVIAALARPLTRTPVIVAGRRNLDDVPARLGPLEDIADVFVRRMTDIVVANSRAVAEDALARGNVDALKLRVIHNGVESIPPISQADRDRLRGEWSASATDLVIGAVANLNPVKGHQLLLQAFDVLAADNRRLRLVIAGEGPTRGMIEAEIRARGLADRVSLIGSVLDPAPLYGAFDLLIHPSLSEGLSNTLLEAGMAGRAIVATSVGGTDEIILDGETGLLIPPGDVGAIVMAAARLIADADLRARLSGAARQHVEATFGMSRFVDEFAGLYVELAERAGIGA